MKGQKSERNGTGATEGRAGQGVNEGVTRLREMGQRRKGKEGKG